MTKSEIKKQSCNEQKKKCKFVDKSREPITAFVIICNAAGPLKMDRSGDARKMMGII